jgi:hypothetical protein
MGERRSLKEGKKRMVDQLRMSWNSLLGGCERPRNPGRWSGVGRPCGPAESVPNDVLEVLGCQGRAGASRGNGRTPHRRIELFKAGRKLGQGLVNRRLELAQGVIVRDPLLQGHVTEHRTLLLVCATHSAILLD